ncbi:hypothetical protein [Devosia lacusdianchii]|uniref:hypothetical protein n=1 Tax=Devosia lacusdianchii TaxID=2917991 RepID=UPI001F068F72|nr:hypothetical protein [Devosia sp. JXJ CY 41]
MAFHTTLFGLVLVMVPDIFDQPSWAGFRSLGVTEAMLGWLMLVLGSARIGGLVVNGARKHVTPLIRQVSAAIGCMIWFGIVYGFASSGVVSTWLAIYPLFGIGELVNIHRAAHDQGETRNGKAA